MPYSRTELEAFTVTKLKTLADYLVISYTSNVLKAVLVESILDKQLYAQEYLETLILSELQDIASIKSIVEYLTMTEAELITAILATQV